MNPATQSHLPALRLALLRLHKTLIDSERVRYEASVGPITSPVHFWNLLSNDAFFAWLRPLSQLITMIDETLDNKDSTKPTTAADIEALTEQARKLLHASESGEGFSRRYFEALQNGADIVVAHSEVVPLLGASKP